MRNIEFHEKLCREVERVIGHRLVSAGDFATLAEKVRARTGERISPTTLMRLFGYIKEDVQPRLMTLNVLARFAGYADYEALEKSDGRADSDPILARSLTDKDLAVGQRLRLCWQPDRSMVVRHNGKSCFSVEEAVNTKLSAGDTFSCHLIVEREPLYLSNLTHNGETGLLYVAGREGGVVFDILT